jgi:hypothetical protein
MLHGAGLAHPQSVWPASAGLWVNAAVASPGPLDLDHALSVGSDAATASVSPGVHGSAARVSSSEADAWAMVRLARDKLLQLRLLQLSSYIRGAFESHAARLEHASCTLGMRFRLSSQQLVRVNPA